MRNVWSGARLRRVLAVTAVGAAAATGSAAVASTASAADKPWGFEMVTPPQKGGGAVNSGDTFTPGPDGDSLLYSTTAPFEGVGAAGSPMYVRYFGTRGPDGWSSRSADVPDRPNDVFNRSFWIYSVIGTSANLEYALVTSTAALAPGATDGGSNLYMQRLRTGSLQLVATSDDIWMTKMMSQPQGTGYVKFVAPDGQSALFTSNSALTPGAPSGFSGAALYSWRAGEGVKAISVLPESEGGATVPAGFSGNDDETGARESTPREGGLDHVYFTPIVNYSVGAVYVRTGDETRAVSVSRIAGASTTPVPASLLAVADGGRYAVFQTYLPERLTEDTPTDLPGANFLYRYDVSDDSLTYIGAMDGVGGVSARVLQMTQDGQTIAFQSGAALAGDAVQAKANMYIWRDGTLHFVAASETSFPSSNATSGGWFLRLLSPSGRYLSFTDNTIALAQRTGFDNVSTSCPAPFIGGPGGCDQVYRFDVETDVLVCVSCRSDGVPPRGHAGDPGIKENGYIRMDAHQMRTVTDEGTVFFTSPDDLVVGDRNGQNDAYMYANGALRLLSRGKPGTSARFVDATRDGKTVFLATDDAIVGTDLDKAVDIYMTRPEAGFPDAAPVSVATCSGSDCRDAQPVSPVAPVIGSVTFSGSGNAPQAPQAATLGVTRKGVVTGSRATVKVRVSGPGLIAVTGTGVKSSRRSATRAATYTLAIALDAKTARSLATRGSVKRTVRVSFTPKEGDAMRKVIAITFKRPASKNRNSTGGR